MVKKSKKVTKRRVQEATKKAANKKPKGVCPICGGKGFTEEQGGLIQRKCRCQR